MAMEFQESRKAESKHGRISESSIREAYRTYVNDNGLYNRWSYPALDYRCRQLFGHVGELTGKNLLEIGGGEGLFSLWALAQGAKGVIVLEPEAEGCTSGAREKLIRHRTAIGLSEEQLIVVPKTLQEFDGEGRLFDLILSHNSINHLDESACAALHSSAKAVGVYLEILKKVYHLLRSQGFCIISDCGRTNYWNRLGLINPFAPDIEWSKHQDPGLWQLLLNEIGFQCSAWKWHSFYPLRSFRKLLANSFIAKWMTSQFVIWAQKMSEAST